MIYICSSNDLNNFQTRIDSIFRLINDDLLCKNILMKSVFNNGYNVTFFKLLCGSDLIEWEFRYRFRSNNKIGCKNINWKIVPKYQNIRIGNDNILISAIVISIFMLWSSLTIIKKFKHQLGCLVSLITFFSFYVKELWSPIHVHYLLHIALITTSIVEAFDIFIDISFIESTCFYLAPILMFPFLNFLIAGSFCPSYSSVFMSIRSAYSLLFADYVFPTFYEQIVNLNVHTGISMLLSLFYLPLALVCLITFCIVTYQFSKYKLLSVKYKRNVLR